VIDQLFRDARLLGNYVDTGVCQSFRSKFLSAPHQELSDGFAYPTLSAVWVVAT
jgi:hypothetical protein